MSWASDRLSDVCLEWFVLGVDKTLEIQKKKKKQMVSIKGSNSQTIKRGISKSLKSDRKNNCIVISIRVGCKDRPSSEGQIDDVQLCCVVLCR